MYGSGSVSSSAEDDISYFSCQRAGSAVKQLCHHEDGLIRGRIIAEVSPEPAVPAVLSVVADDSGLALICHDAEEIAIAVPLEADPLVEHLLLGVFELVACHKPDRSGAENLLAALCFPPCSSICANAM